MGKLGTYHKPWDIRPLCIFGKRLLLNTPYIRGDVLLPTLLIFLFIEVCKVFLFYF